MLKNIFFFLSFWAKHDSCDVYLKYGLIQNHLCEKTFKHENCLFERHFLTKFWLEVVFRKDDFEKYKNFSQKVSFRKTIFTFKSVFYKDDFERVYISNKHHKSHVCPKNFKKKKKKI